MSLTCQDGRNRRGRFQRLAIGSVFVASFAACGGCKLFRHDKTWTNGECAYDQRIHAAGSATCVRYSPRRPVHDGPSAVELAQRASVLEAACDPMCVDLYFSATWKTWQCVAELGPQPSRTDLVAQSQAYDACLAKLLMTAQRYRRLDPTTGLTVFHDGQPLTIPVQLHGFQWTAEDFNQLEVIGEYELTKTAKEVTMSGVGVPLVVVRRRCYDEQFYRRVQPFAATAVLRSRPGCNDPTASAMQELVLEFYNPSQCTHLAGADKRWALAGDLTAPLAWAKSLNPNDPISEFLRPDGNNAKAQLVMLEPYQPGKIPIVFVHGLLSDPTTWATLGNGLRNEAWFRDRYQVWVFRYPSGMPFLVSAATLRQQLNAAIVASPCAVDDPAARQMVLVGHSMGGLVSKLQVTNSGNQLWDLVANRPIDEINASEADRQRMREVFFFAPQPFIRKVIFIGTPHRGAEMASRGIGRVSSCLARSSTEADERHRRIVAANPGVFKHIVAHHVPTSIDLLEPDNPLLVAMEHMPVGPCVQLHSIIGVAKLKHHTGPSDGVVPLASASIRCVASEKLVSETHEELHEAATTLIELERILQKHVLDFDLSSITAARRASQ
jgi:pimeloyl-ACP methyl ester carboxylesterase